MISNILVTALDNAMSLWIEDKVLAVILMLIISAIFWIGGEIKNIIWKVVFYFISAIAILLYLGLPRPLEIMEFATVKPEYNANEKIYFYVRANKKAYYYLYTYNAEDTRILLYPRETSLPNLLNSNKRVRSGGFNVINNPKYKDEKVMLIVSRYPLIGIKQEMSAKSFSKMLTDNKNSTSIEIDGKPEQKVRVISVKIKKPKAHITIDIKNMSYRVTEDVDIDVKSQSEGYAHIFEATPTQNITKLQSSKIIKELRSYTTAKKPIGRHTAIAIYTKENEEMKPTDFIIEEEIIKGEPNYSIRFKNGKKYVYDIVWFKVTP